MSSIGKKFIEMTKPQNVGEPDRAKGIEPPSPEIGYDTEARKINLPKPGEFIIPDRSLKEVMESRKTIRKFSKQPLTLKELSYLLWYTQGVKKVLSDSKTSRTVPSAGGRHAFETILLINNVEGVEPGLYRYLALEHVLAEIETGPGTVDRVVKGSRGQVFIADSAVTFIWVADAYRMTWRFGERGYRYLHLDAGHVCQNLYLAAESIDCGACAVAAFSDDEINKVVGVDGDNQFVIYMGVVGKKGA